MLFHFVIIIDHQTGDGRGEGIHTQSEGKNGSCSRDDPWSLFFFFVIALLSHVQTRYTHTMENETET